MHHELMKDPETERLVAQTQKAIEESRREIEHYKQLQINSHRDVERFERDLQKLLDELRDTDPNKTLPKN
jgi:uncharacterized protein YaiI (UPF0178 family)